MRNEWVDDENDDGYSMPEIAPQALPRPAYSIASIDEHPEAHPPPPPQQPVPAPPSGGPLVGKYASLEELAGDEPEVEPQPPPPPARAPDVGKYRDDLGGDGDADEPQVGPQPAPPPARAPDVGRYRDDLGGIGGADAPQVEPQPPPPARAPDVGKYRDDLGGDGGADAAEVGPQPAPPPRPAPPMFDFRRPAPVPAPRRPPKLPGKPMVQSASEQFGSFVFTHDLAAKRYGLLYDMKRHGLLPSGATMKDLKPATFRMGVKRLWGWTDADVDLYWQLARDPASAGARWKVEYLKGDRKQERKQYAVTPGPIWTDSTGRPFDTSSMVSKASGPGYAIFVMTRSGKVYAGAHRVGLFHHSSFTGGKDVAAAGELKVVDGRLKAVTAKSGHYQPGVEHTQRFLEQLARAGADLRGVQVKVWRATGRRGAFETWLYDAEDLRSKGLAARGLNTKQMF